MIMAVNDIQQVEKCIEDGNLSKLFQLPSELDDFSEISIIKTMEFFMKASEKQIVSATQEVSNDAVKESLSWSKNNVSTTLSDRRCYVLNAILKQRFSVQYLQEAARFLSFDNVLALIKYLHSLLIWIPALTENKTSYPSLDQIIDWLSALLDSHVQQLRLAEDAVDVILPLYDQVTAMTKWQLETRSLLGALAELNRQAKEKQRNTKVGNYCIEVITF